MNKYLLTVLLGLPCTVMAGYNEGVDLFNQQQYERAFTELKPLADQNNERAQYYVAYMYLNGYGHSFDSDLGLSYLKRSADQGFDKAQTLLAYYYSEGKYIKQDKKKAIELYTAASKRGDNDALLNLGVAYYTGDGVDIDEEKGLELLSRVNPANAPSTARRLGDIYQQTSKQALRDRVPNLYQFSASQGDIPAFYSLARLEQEKDIDHRDADKVISYYTYAASQGYAPAQYALGILYANGEFVGKDIVTGAAWVALAAGQQYEPAQKTQTQLESNMTPSNSDKMRSKIVEIQQTIFGKVQPPIARASTISLQNLTGIEKSAEEKTTPIKKRPRSQSRGSRGLQKKGK